MNCVKCYQEIPDGTKFCPYCGAQQPEATDGAEPTILVQPKEAAAEDAPVETASSETASTEQLNSASTESVQQETPVQPEYNNSYYGSEQASGQTYANDGSNQSYSEQTSGQTYANDGSNQSYSEQASGQAYANDGSNQSYSDQTSGQQYGGGYQTPPSYQDVQQKPINWVPYLVISIICTICCCMPFGIVGIVYATKINTAMSVGAYAEAQKSAKTATIWMIASAVTGLVIQIIYILFAVIVGMEGYYYY